MFDALDFLAELTQHVPPKRTQLIQRYGLYSSRIKGRWDQMEYVADRAPAGWRKAHASESDPDNFGYTPLSETQEVDSNARKSAWARLIAGPLLWAVY
jgi:putative transposase